MSQPADDDCCFICLGGNEAGVLQRPCGCPRHVHQQCISRWQLQRAGTDEEKRCRFCRAELPAWTAAYSALPKATPIMTVVFNGITHSIPVYPGRDGRQQFEQRIRLLFGLRPDEPLSLSFGCRLPEGGDITLEDAECFDAAVHLAAISAGARLKREREAAAGAAPLDAGQEDRGASDEDGETGCLRSVRRLFA